MWDLTTRQPMDVAPLGHPDPVTAMATTGWAGGQTAVSGCWDGTVRAWDVETGCPVGTTWTFPAPVQALAVSPHGRVVVSVAGGLALMQLGVDDWPPGSSTAHTRTGPLPGQLPMW